jgi:hypothetical protein
VIVVALIVAALIVAAWLLGLLIRKLRRRD